jgi:hypothetical protein
MRCKTSFIGKQLVLARSLSLDISKSSIFFFRYFCVPRLTKNVLYVTKVVFVSIISRSLILLFYSKEPIERIYVKITFNEMVKAYIFKQHTNI